MFRFDYQKIWIIYLVTTYSVFTLPEPVFSHRSMFIRHPANANSANNATTANPIDETGVTEGDFVGVGDFASTGIDGGGGGEEQKAEESVIAPVVLFDTTGSTSDAVIEREPIVSAVIEPGVVVESETVVEERAPLLAGEDNLVGAESILNRLRSRRPPGKHSRRHPRPSNNRPNNPNHYHVHLSSEMREYDEPRSLEKPILIRPGKFLKNRKPIISVPKFLRNMENNKPSRPHPKDHKDRRQHRERDRNKDLAYERFRRPLPTRLEESHEPDREHEREHEHHNHHHNHNKQSPRVPVGLPLSSPENVEIPVIRSPNESDSKHQSIKDEDLRAAYREREREREHRERERERKHREREQEKLREKERELERERQRQLERERERDRQHREKVKQESKSSLNNIHSDFFPSAQDSAAAASGEKSRPRDILEFVKPNRQNLEPSSSSLTEEPPFYKANRPAEGYLPTDDMNELKEIYSTHHLRKRKECDGLHNFIYDLEIISFLLSLLSAGFGLYADVIPFFNEGVKISYNLDKWGDGEDFPHDYWPRWDTKVEGRTISIGTNEDNIKEVLSVAGEFIGIFGLVVSFVSLFPSVVEKFFYSLDWWFGKRGLWKQYLYTYKCEVHPYPQPGWGKLGR